MKRERLRQAVLGAASPVRRILDLCGTIPSSFVSPRPLFRIDPV